MADRRAPRAGRAGGAPSSGRAPRGRTREQAARPAAARTRIPADADRAARARRTREDAPRSRRRHSTVTTRAAALGLTISALALLLALPVRTYLSQHDEITQTQQDQAAQRHRIAVLQQEVKRDSDPAYIEEQARLRLQLTMPGQTDYVVIPTPARKAPPKKVEKSTAVVPAGDSNQTWFSALWSTDVAAGTKK